MRTPIQAKEDLDLIMPDYIRISQAPSLATLRARAVEAGIPEAQAFSNEWRVRYKAISNGKVYLAQNPALLTWQYDMGRRIHRVTPEFVGFYKDLLKAEGKKAPGPLKQSAVPEDPFSPEEQAKSDAQRKLNF